MWADENAPTFEFLIENGVLFDDVSPTVVNGGTVPRLFVTKPFSENLMADSPFTVCHGSSFFGESRAGKPHSPKLRGTPSMQRKSRAAWNRPAGRANTGSRDYLTNTDIVVLTVWPPGP
jgi:hypothetical protein